MERAVRDEIAKNRSEASAAAKQSREEMGTVFKHVGDSLVKQLGTLQQATDQRLDRLRETNEQKLTEVRTTVEERLKTIQEDNAKNLEQMRQTVDEKLQGTLEQRLGESFKLVSERLEQVYKGLGEMQTLAAGVGT
jgi:DNA recombination protein RmuC